MVNYSETIEKLHKELEQLRFENEALKAKARYDVKEKMHTDEEIENFRKNVQKFLKKKTLKKHSSPSEADALRLVQELEGHQIELEMQNEELMRAQEEEELLKEKYAELYDFAPTGYFTLSKEGDIIELNLVGSLMLGKERWHLISNRFSFFVTDETKPIFRQFLSKVFASQSIEICEVTILAAGNLPLHVHLTGFISEKSGECLLSVVDITDRKLAEEKIKDLARKWQSTFDSIKDSIFLIDPKGIILQANKISQSIYGIAGKQLVGQKCHEIVHKDSCHVEGCPLAKMKLSKQRESITMQVDDKWIEIVVDPIIDEKNILTGAVHIISDVTERKQAEKVLRENEEIFRSFLEHSPIYVYFKDENIRSLKASKNFETMLGMPVKEILGKNMQELFPSEFAKKMVDDDLRVLNEGKAVTIEEEFDGRSYITIKFPILIDGKPSFLAGYTIDITERKRAEEEIKIKNELLLSLNFAKDKFFSIIAHDLKSPFQGFLGLSEVLANSATDLSPEDLSRFGINIHKSAVNLFNLLKNLLDWAQMQKGNMEFNPKEFSISELIAGNVEIIAEKSEQKGVIIVNMVRKPIHVYADEKMINSVLLNLISNAVKFTSRGDIVTIIATEKENQMIEISISDTGVGMKKSIVDKLFILGEKVGSQGTAGELSTGLGLILCKEFVEKNGGLIWAESEERKRTTFYFTLNSIKNNGK